MLITGSIARNAKCQYSCYAEGDCIDGGEIWHAGVDQTLIPNIITENFTKFRNINAQQGVSFDVGCWPIIINVVVAVHAEFDQYLDIPVLLHSVTLLQDWIDCHHLLQETWHVSSPFITAVPGTESASPGNKITE